MGPGVRTTVSWEFTSAGGDISFKAEWERFSGGGGGGREGKAAKAGLSTKLRLLLQLKHTKGRTERSKGLLLESCARRGDVAREKSISREVARVSSVPACSG